MGETSDEEGWIEVERWDRKRKMRRKRKGMRSEKGRGIGVVKVEDVWTEENGMVKWRNGRNVVQEEGKI